MRTDPHGTMSTQSSPGSVPLPFVAGIIRLGPSLFRGSCVPELLELIGASTATAGETDDRSEGEALDAATALRALAIGHQELRHTIRGECDASIGISRLLESIETASSPGGRAAATWALTVVVEGGRSAIGQGAVGLLLGQLEAGRSAAEAEAAAACLCSILEVSPIEAATKSVSVVARELGAVDILSQAATRFDRDSPVGLHSLRALSVLAPSDAELAAQSLDTDEAHSSNDLVGRAVRTGSVELSRGASEQPSKALAKQSDHKHSSCTGEEEPEKTKGHRSHVDNSPGDVEAARLDIKETVEAIVALLDSLQEVSIQMPAKEATLVLERAASLLLDGGTSVCTAFCLGGGLVLLGYAIGLETGPKPLDAALTCLSLAVEGLSESGKLYTDQCLSSLGQALCECGSPVLVASSITSALLDHSRRPWGWEKSVLGSGIIASLVSMLQDGCSGRAEAAALVLRPLCDSPEVAEQARESGVIQAMASLCQEDHESETQFAAARTLLALAVNIKGGCADEVCHCGPRPLLAMLRAAREEADVLWISEALHMLVVEQRQVEAAVEHGAVDACLEVLAETRQNEHRAAPEVVHGMWLLIADVLRELAASSPGARSAIHSTGAMLALADLLTEFTSLSCWGHAANVCLALWQVVSDYSAAGRLAVARVVVPLARAVASCPPAGRLAALETLQEIAAQNTSTCPDVLEACAEAALGVLYKATIHPDKVTEAQPPPQRELMTATELLGSVCHSSTGAAARAVRPSMVGQLVDFLALQQDLPGAVAAGVCRALYGLCSNSPEHTAAAASQLRQLQGLPWLAAMVQPGPAEDLRVAAAGLCGLFAEATAPSHGLAGPCCPALPLSSAIGPLLECMEDDTASGPLAAAAARALYHLAAHEGNCRVMSSRSAASVLSAAAARFHGVCDVTRWANLCLQRLGLSVGSPVAHSRLPGVPASAETDSPITSMEAKALGSPLRQSPCLPSRIPRFCHNSAAKGTGRPPAGVSEGFLSQMTASGCMVKVSSLPRAGEPTLPVRWEGDTLPGAELGGTRGPSLSRIDGTEDTAMGRWLQSPEDLSDQPGHLTAGNSQSALQLSFDLLYNSSSVSSPDASQAEDPLQAHHSPKQTVAEAAADYLLDTSLAEEWQQDDPCAEDTTDVGTASCLHGITVAIGKQPGTSCPEDTTAGVAAEYLMETSANGEPKQPQSYLHPAADEAATSGVLEIAPAIEQQQADRCHGNSAVEATRKCLLDTSLAEDWQLDVTILDEKTVEDTAHCLLETSLSKECQQAGPGPEVISVEATAGCLLESNATSGHQPDDSCPESTLPDCLLGPVVGRSRQHPQLNSGRAGEADGTATEEPPSGRGTTADADLWSQTVDMSARDAEAEATTPNETSSRDDSYDAQVVRGEAAPQPSKPSRADSERGDPGPSLPQDRGPIRSESAIPASHDLTGSSAGGDAGADEGELQNLTPSHHAQTTSLSEDSNQDSAEAEGGPGSSTCQGGKLDMTKPEAAGSSIPDFTTAGKQATVLQEPSAERTGGTNLAAVSLLPEGTVDGAAKALSAGQVDSVQELFHLLDPDCPPRLHALAARAVCCISQAETHQNELVQAGAVPLLLRTLDGCSGEQRHGTAREAAGAIASLALSTGLSKCLTDHGAVPILSRCTGSEDSATAEAAAVSLKALAGHTYSALEMMRHGVLEKLVSNLTLPAPSPVATSAECVRNLIANEHVTEGLGIGQRQSLGDALLAMLVDCDSAVVDSAVGILTALASGEPGRVLAPLAASHGTGIARRLLPVVLGQRNASLETRRSAAQALCALLWWEAPQEVMLEDDNLQLLLQMLLRSRGSADMDLAARVMPPLVALERVRRSLHDGEAAKVLLGKICEVPWGACEGLLVVLHAMAADASGQEDILAVDGAVPAVLAVWTSLDKADPSVLEGLTISSREEPGSLPHLLADVLALLGSSSRGRSCLVDGAVAHTALEVLSSTIERGPAELTSWACLLRRLCTCQAGCDAVVAGGGFFLLPVALSRCATLPAIWDTVASSLARILSRPEHSCAKLQVASSVSGPLKAALCWRPAPPDSGSSSPAADLAVCLARSPEALEVLAAAGILDLLTPPDGHGNGPCLALQTAGGGINEKNEQAGIGSASSAVSNLSRLLAGGVPGSVGASDGDEIGSVVLGPLLSLVDCEFLDNSGQAAAADALAAIGQAGGLSEVSLVLLAHLEDKHSGLNAHCRAGCALVLKQMVMSLLEIGSSPQAADFLVPLASRQNLGKLVSLAESRPPCTGPADTVAEATAELLSVVLLAQPTAVPLAMEAGALKATAGLLQSRRSGSTQAGVGLLAALVGSSNAARDAASADANIWSELCTSIQVGDLLTRALAATVLLSLSTGDADQGHSSRLPLPFDLVACMLEELMAVHPERAAGIIEAMTASQPMRPSLSESQRLIEFLVDAACQEGPVQLPSLEALLEVAGGCGEFSSAEGAAIALACSIAEDSTDPEVWNKTVDVLCALLLGGGLSADVSQGVFRALRGEVLARVAGSKESEDGEAEQEERLPSALGALCKLAAIPGSQTDLLRDGALAAVVSVLEGEGLAWGGVGASCAKLLLTLTDDHQEGLAELARLFSGARVALLATLLDRSPPERLLWLKIAKAVAAEGRGLCYHGVVQALLPSLADPHGPAGRREASLAAQVLLSIVATEDGCKAAASGPCIRALICCSEPRVAAELQLTACRAIRRLCSSRAVGDIAALDVVGLQGTHILGHLVVSPDSTEAPRACAGMALGAVLWRQPIAGVAACEAAGLDPLRLLSRICATLCTDAGDLQLLGDAMLAAVQASDSVQRGLGRPEMAKKLLSLPHGRPQLLPRVLAMYARAMEGPGGLATRRAFTQAGGIRLLCGSLAEGSEAMEASLAVLWSLSSSGEEGVEVLADADMVARLLRLLPPSCSPAVSTLCQVRACHILAALLPAMSFGASGRTEALGAIICCLSNRKPQLQSAAALALASLAARSREGARAVSKGGGVKSLVDLFVDSLALAPSTAGVDNTVSSSASSAAWMDPAVASVRALATISGSSSEQAIAVARAGAIEELAGVLESEAHPMELVVACTEAVSALSICPDVRRHIAKAGLPGALARLLVASAASELPAGGQRAAAAGLTRLMCAKECGHHVRKLVGEAGLAQQMVSLLLGPGAPGQEPCDETLGKALAMGPLAEILKGDGFGDSARCGAALGLAQLTQDPGVRRTAVEAGCVPRLVVMLAAAVGKPGLQEAVAAALRSLMRDDRARLEALRSGAVRALVDTAKHGTPLAREGSLGALRGLTALQSGASEAVRAGAVAVASAALTRPASEANEGMGLEKLGAEVLGNLATAVTSTDILRRANTVPTLVSLVKAHRGHPAPVLAFCKVASSRAARPLVLQADGALAVLVALLWSDHPNVQAAASEAIRRLAADAGTRDRILSLGAAEALWGVQSSGHEVSATAAAGALAALRASLS